VYVTPTSPKGGTKRTRFCCFASKIQLLSAIKFLSVKTFSSKVVATSFPYLTIHTWIAGDGRYRLPKICAESDPPFRKRRSRQISLNSASDVRGSKRVHRAIDEPCALPLCPPKGGSKRGFLHLALPFVSALKVILDTSNLVCGWNIASPSMQMTNRP